ncbi:hypothetical protein E0Z10_g10805 [Xylaria hypoxylon]|uniref:Uncharacterized protein n=1 Tax=Xylaria hypoxylon TaxID=37992 RepID=A0A4Z0YBJ2_9PEZI|nr:hypothetical protein E0Z10_g10805 [Xylaria hypoxylon]
MMNIFTVPLFLALVTASPGLYDGPFDINSSSIPPGLDAYSLNAVINAQQHPNATRGVVFKPFGFEGGTGTPGAVSTFGDIEWAWRINVSDFTAPNSTTDGSDEPVDTHLVTTTYDFNWPVSDELSTKLNSSTARFCLTMANFHDLPVNVTNAYTDNDSNSPSCASTLGQACVDAILKGGSFQGDAESGYCQGPSQIWSSIPECQNTLGYTSTVSHGFSLNTFSRGFGNQTTQNATKIFTSGGGWSGYFSSPQNSSGSNEYYTDMNRLHIVMVNALLPASTSFEGGYSEGTQLLCMRVNTTKLPTHDTNGDGVTWTSEAVLESAASMGYLAQRILNWTSLPMWLVGLMLAVVV